MLQKAQNAKAFVYALGFFDGVHLGHQALLNTCQALAREEKAQACALTFDRHPMALTCGQAPALLNTGADRVRLLSQWGMDQVQTLHFDRTTMELPWQDFFQLLLTRYGACGLVCGDDFRFGYRGQGTAALLQQACREAGIPCRVVSEQTVDGIRVSSSYIRRLLESGEMEKAVKYLGHPHVLSGEVVSGRRLGRTIGVPTANLLIPEGVIVPKLGVYACKVTAGDGEYFAVTNVGSRPTVGGHRVTVEPWLLDFDGDLYGKTIAVEFFCFLRPEKKFDSLEALKEQIDRDAQGARRYFSREKV